MMSYFQTTTCKPQSRVVVNKPIPGLGSTSQHPLYSHALRFHRLQQKVYPRLLLVAASHKRLTPVCVLSGKGNAGTADDPLMESLKKAMADAKKPRSIQDLLKEQVAKLREQASGGGGGNGNRRGGSGGSGGPDDESFKEALDEVVQVILATVAFILVYIHIIRGEELYRLARDYTRYLVTGKRTARLKRSMQKWHNFSESFMQKEGSEEDQYEKPTWWQQPQKLVHLMEELCRGNWRPHAQES
ncbi:glycine-rich protein isoform X1 [Zea mays]|uniref:Glycine-rich protein n=1 Tax=Zea mays TaxID=4577 RepID=B4FKL2_MAIZE|nr:glycine-rich protein isoform X1 [Zea mays]ACF82655.1 unknown [Zea mays]AQK53468.1 glycine-rich protein [Zea mays]AQK53469.1 glycine-rich protein [Zea mays]|eukprot:XP_008676767.1 glycine-rich protein isoform X1 [Zea mays]